MTRAANAPMTRAEFEALAPRARGYAVYWFGENPDQPNVPDERCPYPEGSADAAEWHEGQRRAMLDAQDGEE